MVGSTELFFVDLIHSVVRKKKERSSTVCAVFYFPPLERLPPGVFSKIYGVYKFPPLSGFCPGRENKANYGIVARERRRTRSPAARDHGMSTRNFVFSRRISSQETLLLKRAALTKSSPIPACTNHQGFSACHEGRRPTRDPAAVLPATPLVVRATDCRLSISFFGFPEESRRAQTEKGTRGERATEEVHSAPERSERQKEVYYSAPERSKKHFVLLLGLARREDARIADLAALLMNFTNGILDSTVHSQNSPQLPHMY